jgi:hypothetical protein
MLEDFKLSSFITENTPDVQMFFWLRYIRHTEYGKLIAMLKVMWLTIVKVILYRDMWQAMYG